MRTAFTAAACAALAALLAAAAHAQADPNAAQPPQATLAPGEIAGPDAAPDAAPNAADPGLEPAEPEWSLYASAFFYLVPDDRDFVQPTLIADRGPLHLEVRYNYEALDTVSAWVGVNFGGGETVEWTFTPMLGAVFGDLTGVAPGYRFSLAWWKLEFATEGEFVFVTDDEEDNFFYSWSELSLSPVEPLRVGVALQRTRVFDEDRELQFGLLAGVAVGALDLSAYVFNLDEDTPTLILALGLSF